MDFSYEIDFSYEENFAYAMDFSYEMYSSVICDLPRLTDYEDSSASITEQLAIFRIDRIYQGF
jgi:hypothetical protein